jgi:hypothetical protein
VLESRQNQISSSALRRSYASELQRVLWNGLIDLSDLMREPCPISPCSGAGGTPSGLTSAALVLMSAAARVADLVVFASRWWEAFSPSCRGRPAPCRSAFSSSRINSPIRMEARQLVPKPKV